MSNTVSTYKVVDNRGDDFGDKFLTAYDIVLAFSAAADGCSWSIQDHGDMPKHNPAFTLVSMYDKDDNLIDKFGVRSIEVDDEEKLMNVLEEEDEGDVSYVVLTNEFDVHDHVYFLKGY